MFFFSPVLRPPYLVGFVDVAIPRPSANPMSSPLNEAHLENERDRKCSPVEIKLVAAVVKHRSGCDWPSGCVHVTPSGCLFSYVQRGTEIQSTG